MTATDAAGHAASNFIRALFGLTTEQPVYICSLANERDDPHEPGERRVSTRDGADIARFIHKWDRPRRGLFFAVGTVAAGAKREKTSIRESIGLHADLDLKNIDADEPAVREALRSVRLPPSAMVRSGNGLHAYWLFREALVLPEEGEEREAAVTRLEQALRLLADHIAGDLQVCEVSRLMRLPGTHNTKNGAWTEVVCEFSDGPRYELDDLEEWLEEAAPVLRRKQQEQAVGTAPADTNPFLAAAARLGYQPPLDVEQRLAAMTFGGAGDSAIHATQLAVSASLLNIGQEVEEVVGTLLTATRAAAGELGSRWNWRREEQALRKMCETWLRKHPRETRPSLEQVKAREEVVNGGHVVNLAEKRQERTKKKPKPATADKQTIANVVADGVIEAVRAVGQDMLLTEGEMWLYEGGTWHVATPADQQWLLTLVQTGFETLGEPAKPANLNAAWKRLTEHPSLFHRSVAWAGGDVIVCQNGVLEIASRKFHPHAPSWYARRKIGVAYEPGATCPQFLRLLEAMFADRTEPADRAAFMHVIQSWAGSAMAVEHLSREERKALILVGPSRTGKTELSRIIRLLIGDPIATPSVSEVSERFGLSSLYEAAAWIRDDAINEGDDLDPQRFKTIVTGEPIDIERKHRPAVPGVELALPVLLTTNALPRARDKSDAIFNRSLVIEMTNVVTEDAAHAMRQQLGTPRGETVGTYIMAGEGPGVLNWALDGLASLLERGSYDLPESVRAAIQRFKDDNNPVGEWARSAIVRAATGKVSRADLMCAYHGWQREQDGDEARAFGARAFFPRLRAVAPWVGEASDRNGRRYVTGLALTDEGLQLWDLHNQGPQLKGGSKGSSLDKTEVNRVTEGMTTVDSNAPRF